MNNQRHSRDFSLKIQVPEGSGPITAMVSRNGQMEVYTRGAIYEVLLPDQMDQGRKNPNLPPATKKIASVGSGHPIVARVYLQPRQIMGNFTLKHSTPEEILEHFRACMNSILQAEQIARVLLDEFNSLLAASKGKGFPVEDGVLRAPHIENLQFRLGDFFRYAKAAIQSVGDAFNSFYGLSHNDKPVKNGNFDYARDYLKRQTIPFPEYFDFLESSKAFTAFIIRARNGYDHPSAESLKISNFEIQDSALVCPHWNFPSEKPTAIFLDLPVLVSSLVQFAEANFNYCFIDNNTLPLAPEILPIPDDQINPDCPMTYRLEFLR